MSPTKDISSKGTLARLLSRTDIVGDCWVSTRPTDAGGYTTLWFDGKSIKTHRIAWWLATGHWPTRNEHICHDCPGGDNPACWRNDAEGVHILNGVTYEKHGHLWLGDATANIEDRQAKGRTATGDRQGLRLHPESRRTGERHPYFTRPDLILRGERNPRAILTDALVREIRQRFDEGDVTKEQLSREYGIAGTGIGRIVRHESWKHVL